MDDLISRKLAIKAIRNAVDQWNIVDPFHVGIKRGLICGERIVGSLPSAESVRMKGRWIYGESEEGHDGYFCSQCGNFVPWIYKEFDIDFIKEFKFCPNCGARMSEGEDDAIN